MQIFKKYFHQFYIIIYIKINLISIILFSINNVSFYAKIVSDKKVWIWFEIK